MAQDVNPGYDALLLDVGLLLDEVKTFQFDDFKNSKYAAPKIALTNRLEELIKNTQGGKYDN